MIQAIIVEDERPSAQRLATQIEKLEFPIKIIASLRSVSEAKGWFKDNSPPDLIFLDIQLGDGTAFDLLEDLDIKTPIIFTTAYDEYAIKAFEFNSIDYLLKPVELNKLSNAVSKLQNISDLVDSSNQIQDQFQSVQRIVTGDFKKRFLVKLGDQFIPIDTSEIHYFFYDGGSSWIMTSSGKKYLLEQSLDQLENLVNPLDFYRINRQYLLSVRSISEIHAYFNSRLLIKLNPERDDDVIVSRDRVSDFKKWMDL